MPRAERPSPGASRNPSSSDQRERPSEKWRATSKKTPRAAAVESLAAAIETVAASFTPEAIAQVQDAPKRVQILLGLTRARKLLVGKPSKKSGRNSSPAGPQAELGVLLSEAEWGQRFPPRYPQRDSPR